MRIIFRVCERIQVLDYGKSLAVGSPDEIQRRTSRSSPPTSGRRARRSRRHTSVLKMTDLCVHYGRVRRVQSLALEVNEGELVGLVGHNGAGKTTTLIDDRRRRSGRPRATSSSRAGRIVGRVARRDPAAGHRARPGGPADLRPPHRGREPPDRRDAPGGPRRDGRGDQAHDRALPGAGARTGRSPARSSRAASSSSSRSRGRSSRGRSCSCSTSRRSASRR